MGGADICLIAEGCYPFVTGGVSAWIQDLLLSHPDRTFHVVPIVAPLQNCQIRYPFPPNLIDFSPLILQKLPLSSGKSLTRGEKKEFYPTLEKILLGFLNKGTLISLKALMQLFETYPHGVSQEGLLDSPEAWEVLLNFYKTQMSSAGFMDFFWAWRSLFTSLYSILKAPLPKAGLYHATCTGYAGVLLARAHVTTNAPCILTEHGIYTNERQIEISLADWIDPQKSFSLQMEKTSIDRELKEFWMRHFNHYAKMCYTACDTILTLHTANRDIQIAHGADARKIHVVPNGIDYEAYASLDTVPQASPTIALMGRVVPIKDIQTFIQACALVKEHLPTLQAYILGPTEEDPDYARECLETVGYAGLKDTVHFMGKVNIRDYLSRIDINVLTSLSESQPLVILEAGAAGIPTVATDVGACGEMLYGSSTWKESLDPDLKGGEIVEVSSPEALARAVIELLTHKERRQKLGKTMQRRVREHYNKNTIQEFYADLYTRYLGTPQERSGRAQERYRGH